MAINICLKIQKMGLTSNLIILTKYRYLLTYCLLFVICVVVLIPGLYNASSAMPFIYTRKTNRPKNSIADVTLAHQDLQRKVTHSYQSTERIVFPEMRECFNTTVGREKGDVSLYLRRDSQNDFKCKHVMTAGFKYKGRLGNQLFRVAALIAIAMYHGYIAIIDKSLPINNVFDLPNVSGAHVLNASEFIPMFCCKFDKKVKFLSHQRNWTLEGQFQSWKYFEGSDDIVKRAFKIKENFSRIADNLINMTVLPTTVKIGIHVRRGDFLSLKNQGFAVAPIDYIKKAVAHFRNKYKLVHFFVVSDDKIWCKNNLAWPDFTVSPFYIVGHDMALMIQCDHVIVTSGTFGWWGAWLAGGETVYWTGYPTNGSRLARVTNHMDYYPHHWIGLS